jgi:ABC-type multidrug transport system ATPase subunit
MHCVAGRSGSGKTGILKATAGLVRAVSGSVLAVEQPPRFCNG